MNLHPQRQIPDAADGAAPTARAFADAPDAAQACALLADVADLPCQSGPVSLDRPLALYGAGNLGRLARDTLRAVGRDAAMAIDRHAAHYDGAAEWAGVPVRHPDAVSAEDKARFRVAVSIVTAPYVPLAAALRAQGFDDVVPFYDVVENLRAVHPLSNGWFAAPFTAEDSAETAAALARWDDDVSRAHHLQFTAWRRLRAEWSFAGAPVTVADRYLIPEVLAVLNDREQFVDAGAHHGSVIQSFLACGPLQSIVAIEPDAENRAVLAPTLPASASMFDCALSDRDGEAQFHAGLGYASQIAPTGRARVMTRRLDTLDVPASILKLHIEGHELAALQGARETLTRQRPIVMTTVYHNADGLWRTARWLAAHLDDYRLLFRLHGWCGTGAVVYAIPRERG